MMMTPRFPVPARRLLAALALLILAGAGAGYAQSSTTRVVAIPLQGSSELEAWSVGVAVGLQRSLNAIDGVFVPPVGDAVVLADRAARADLEPSATLLDRFGADAVIGGRIASAPNGMDVVLERYGPDGAGEARGLTVPADPAEALPRIVAAAIELLGLDVASAEASAAEAVAAGAPPVEALRPAAVAASRLPGPDAATLRTATELAPRSSWVLAEHARAASAEGAHERAIASATAATDAVPEDVEAWTIRGVVNLRAGDAEAAEAAFREALDRNPSHAVARAGLASLREPAEARRELERALEAYPRLLDAHLALAELTEGPRGLQHLRTASERLPDAIEIHAAVVGRALEANDPAGALAYLREAANDPLARSPALYALAEALGASRPDAALAFVREGREAFPEARRTAIAEARLLLDAGDAAGAEAAIRPFHEAAPEDPRAANVLALALVAQERADEARAVLGAASAEDATIRFNLAQALLEAGRPSAAADELAPDMGEGQQDPERWAVYGTALAGAGRFEEARAAYERALELQPEQALATRGLRRLDQRSRVSDDGTPLPPEAQAAYDDGRALLEAGRHAEAVDAFRRAVDAAPDRPLLSFYLGTALQRDGRVREALDAYAPALEAFGESGTVLNNVGFAHLQMGRYDRALPTLRDAVAASPENARAHLNLGLTYYGLSRFEDALDAWRTATDLDPELAPAIEDVRERAERMAGGSAE